MHNLSPRVWREKSLGDLICSNVLSDNIKIYYEEMEIQLAKDINQRPAFF